jgi:putative transposase
MIKEARQNGARLKQACNIVGITDRTYQRWVVDDKIKEDQRPYADRPEPANKLTKQEYNSVIKVTSLPQYADLPPSQIVPSLADKGVYIASESTMYRILKNENMQHHRGRSKSPSKSRMPDTHVATDPNQVWSWDYSDKKVIPMFLAGSQNYLYFISIKIGIPFCSLL